jgi:hypothetical protein
MVRLMPHLRTDQVLAMVRDTHLSRRIINGRAYLVEPSEIGPYIPAFLKRQAPRLPIQRPSRKE